MVDVGATLKQNPDMDVRPVVVAAVVLVKEYTVMNFAEDNE